jgi:hypothetical protein
MSESGNGEVEEGRSVRPRNSRVALQIVAVFLVLVGMTALFWTVIGFRDGWLVPAWNDLSEAQGSIIASLVTLYAAALAAILGPIIFTGQIANMHEASELARTSFDSQVERMAEQLEHIRKVVSQTEEEVSERRDEEGFDPKKALLRLEGIRESAIALAQQIVDKSRKHKATKDKLKGKWPGREPYYIALEKENFITDRQRDLFVQIARTRQIKEGEVKNETLTEAESTLEKLKAETASS